MLLCCPAGIVSFTMRWCWDRSPEIAPPIARQVDRDSGTFGVQSFDYGPVEIASEVMHERIAQQNKSR